MSAPRSAPSVSTPESSAESTPEPTAEATPESTPAVVMAEADPSTDPVEPYLGFRDFLGVLPELRGLTPGLRIAHEAALRGWMRLSGQNVNGHYPLAVWQAHYTNMLAHT